MTFWSIRLVLELVFWAIAADKSRWKEILPVCFFAGYLSLVIDQVCELLNLWEYSPSDTFADLINALGLYMIVTYLFIQWLPKATLRISLLTYFFIWTSISISLEFMHVRNGNMVYHHWNLAYSYIADWVLFWLFYKFYKIFNFQKLRS